MDKTNELYILDRDLNIIQTTVIDDITPNEDIVSPQKTVIEIPLNKSIEIGCFLLIKENGKSKYLGIVQDIVNEKTTKIFSYPIINSFDVECVLKDINGNVGVWIIEAINNNFVSINDKYTKLPIVFEQNSIIDTLELQLKTNNLFERNL